MPIFDPYTSLPTYPAHMAQAQIAARSALPLREIVHRRVFICAASNPSRDIIDHARAAALRAHRLAATGWIVIVVRDDGIASEVVKTCRYYDIPCEVVSSKKDALERAQKVVAFDRLDVIRQAAKLRIPAYWNGVAIPVQLALL